MTSIAAIRKLANNGFEYLVLFSDLEQFEYENEFIDAGDEPINKEFKETWYNSLAPEQNLVCPECHNVGSVQVGESLIGGAKYLKCSSCCLIPEPKQNLKKRDDLPF